ncbi:ExbD/TolR family protein [Sphingopyxis macrogoltabida]|uniref:Biopolymer transporter ExbD n=1 Tax=Sphingopyxis macrogoltabida TaxID=33050 RepID=A0AAC8YWN7_SPHMC|nr:biopolymer transporter ExbD [Sphingopyxis macrogoltabida]ALJ11450.1 biopolymer transporter ExbD [Sphingopyxis macrogoltabida]AMU87643.1 biopolymer transporter ExbD [Sphingopyxis macrogoltabida]
MRRRRSAFHRSIFRADPNGDPDINTTPLIDVMLVMLVMFIITIPPPTHSVDITLPAGPGVDDKVLDENRVTIDTSDMIRWNGEAVDLAELGQLVKVASERTEQPVLMFEPEARARYLRVDEAIGAIRRNGGSKLAFPGIREYGGLI